MKTVPENWFLFALSLAWQLSNYGSALSYLFLVFHTNLMKDDTQQAASKATDFQSENIIYSLEFKEAIFFFASKQPYSVSV